MNTAVELPNVDEIAELSLRGIVTYASRSSRRLVVRALQRRVDSCEELWHISNELARSREIERDVEARAIGIAKTILEDFADVFVARPEEVPDKLPGLQIALSVIATANTCIYTCECVFGDDCKREKFFRRAVRAAAQVARHVKDKSFKRHMRSDFECLKAILREHESNVLGEPIEPADIGPLGPLFPE